MAPEPHMDIPVVVTFRNTPPSASVEKFCQDEANRLLRLTDKVTKVRVVIDHVHLHHLQRSNLEVNVVLTMPDGSVAANHERPRDASENLVAAVRSAFTVARRQLVRQLNQGKREVGNHDGV
ncbi:MAG: HPF/RaiA family ribosome-associated protein [Planctomycetota bacterium]|jgi:ribosome-associated translation inhibitor RaiA